MCYRNVKARLCPRAGLSQHSCVNFIFGYSSKNSISINLLISKACILLGFLHEITRFGHGCLGFKILIFPCTAHLVYFWVSIGFVVDGQGQFSHTACVCIYSLLNDEGSARP